MAIVATLIGSLLLSACTGSTGQAAQTDVSKSEKVSVATGAVENRIVATGKVIARGTSNIAFSQSGVVRDIRVKEGQQVKIGDVLAVLDNTDLVFTALASYSATVKGPSTGDKASAEASLASAKAALEIAQRGGSAADRLRQPPV